MPTRRKVLFGSKLIILFMIGMVAFGCARRNLVGSPIDEANIPKLAIGSTTYTEVLRLFGSPYQIESQGDRQVMTYLYGQEFFWTVWIYFENQSKADVLKIFLDKEGIVRDYSFSKGVATPEFNKLLRIGP